ncbi:MAG: hypothetical protein M3379_16190 [Acidobacteriota bacterium]|nr:hypothetical protein [Acidobacteriota bacterium]
MQFLASESTQGIFWLIFFMVIAVFLGVSGLGLARRWRREESLRRDLARDIGIAFLVAFIVTLTFEVSTRNIAERETQFDTLNKAMSSFVPKDVWMEVTKQVMSKNVLRRNVDIKMRLVRDELPDGQKISLPCGQAALVMSYSYDLYGLSPGTTPVEVSHVLGYEMWNKEQNLPRFNRVTVVYPDGAPPIVYQGDELRRIDDKKGSIVLKDADAVVLPPPDRGVPVRVTTERYEIVNVPGTYNLIMPELVARPLDTKAPTITLSVESLPPEVEAKVDTYYAPHVFKKPDRDKNFWSFDSIMLPGQGLTVVFTPRGTPQSPGQPAESGS